MSHFDEPVVSALVSTYNARHLVRGCLESLLHQTIAPQLEIILIDSCSTTKDYEIAAEMQSQHPQIHFLRTGVRENSHATLNRAIGIARGKYLVMANTDDRHRNDALEKQAAILDEEPAIALVYADGLRTSVLNETYEEALERCRPIVRWPDYRPHRIFGDARIGPQPMWRRSLHQEIGMLDDSLECAGDYEFWLRIAAKTSYRMHHLSEVLGLWYDAPTTNSQSRPDLVRSEAEAVRRRYRDQLIRAGKLPPNGTPLEMELDQYQRAFDGKTIALFGAGERGDRILDALTSRRQNVVAFLDNEAAKIGKPRQGVPVVSPDSAVRVHVADFIIVASMYWAEIAVQLQKLGLEPEKDYAVCYS